MYQILTISKIQRKKDLFPFTNHKDKRFLVMYQMCC